MPLRDAGGGMADRHESDARGVLYGLVVQRNLMLRGDRLRRVVNGLHLFQPVIKPVEAIGRADVRAAAALCEGFHAHGSDEDEEDGKLVVDSQVNSHDIAPWFALTCAPVRSLR